MTANPQVLLCLGLGVAATAEDLWRRQISNWIPAVALLGGIALHWAERGWWGGLLALGGAVGGFVVFLAFYLLGGMGGADVKLMAGFGAILGPSLLLWAAFWTAAAGGVFGLGALVFYRLRRWWLRRPAVAAENSIPYAPAITVGAWLALLSR
ncbi:MAG: prepilin peptidase [Bryobacteraceae bacterium]|nr:prepilin peptidase [Bryobacteraceae bacterium]